MINWGKISTVLLDMDGTLLDLNFDNFFWRELLPVKYAEINQLSEQKAKEKLYALFAEKEGQLEWYCIDYWSEQLAIDIMDLKEGVADKICLLPHAAEFLACLKRMQIDLILVTNAHSGSLGLKKQKSDIFAFFDKIISSHELGMPKENHDFWVKLLEFHPFQPENTLLVDDSLAVLASAHKYGIHNLLAISRPDSCQPERTIESFQSIPDFSYLLPSLRIHMQQLKNPM